ncbi:MAG: YjjG family noncanonical pyrimidine nucleotidase [Clostridia bacterium]|nr:YjjG family noncanonical pyrimidine nucleotidase [Clostridia bacterium]
MKRYTTFLMDADETLFDFKKAEAAGLRAALAECGIACTDEMVVRYSQINDALWKQLERGETTRAELVVARFSRFAAEYGFSLDAPHFDLRFKHHLAEASFLFDGAEAVCRGLIARGATIHIITNGSATIQHRRFAACPARDCFTTLFISEEMGVPKPERAFFEQVFAVLPEVAPSEMLIVGDSLTSDIAGGVNAGIDTCWYNPSAKENPSPHTPTYEIRSLDELYRFCR